MDLVGRPIDATAQSEWQAWRVLCDHLQRIGIDVDRDTELTNLIKLYAQRYHEFKVARGE